MIITKSAALPALVEGVASSVQKKKGYTFNMIPSFILFFLFSCFINDFFCGIHYKLKWYYPFFVVY